MLNCNNNTGSRCIFFVLTALMLGFFLNSCSLKSRDGSDGKIAPIVSGATNKTAQSLQPESQTGYFQDRDLPNESFAINKIKVALLLPLSGKNKDLGWSLANGATLSLFENDNKHSVELVLFDSGDDVVDTKKALKAIVDAGIKFVIGPVFSNAILEIEPIVREKKIIMISLSNNQELFGKVGEDFGILLAGVLPEAQIDRIVGRSVRQSKFNFAIIAPNNSYGRTVANIYKQMVKGRDGNLIAEQFYEPSDQSIDLATSKVLNSFTVPIGVLQSHKNNIKNISEYDKNYAQIIFIPDSGKNLLKVANSLKQKNIEEKRFQIVGINQWEEPITLTSKALEGAWFVAPDNREFQIFEKKYSKHFGKVPPRVSSIVYDLVAVMTKLSRVRGSEIRIKDIVEFSDYIDGGKIKVNGFVGIDGAFRFLSNGLNQRNMAIFKISNGGFEMIERPATTFLKY